MCVSEERIPPTTKVVGIWLAVVVKPDPKRVCSRRRADWVPDRIVPIALSLLQDLE